MTSRSSVEEVNKKYQQNFLLHNNNEITACIADLFNSFCEEVYAVAFFKVVQQQTTGEWKIQLCVCGQIISVCNSERIIKIDSICESYAQNEKGPVFWLTVYIVATHFHNYTLCLKNAH